MKALFKTTKAPILEYNSSLSRQNMGSTKKCSLVLEPEELEGSWHQNSRFLISPKPFQRQCKFYFVSGVQEAFVQPTQAHVVILGMSCAEPRVGLGDPCASLPTQPIP